MRGAWKRVACAQVRRDTDQLTTFVWLQAYKVTPPSAIQPVEGVSFLNRMLVSSPQMTSPCACCPEGVWQFVSLPVSSAFNPPPWTRFSSTHDHLAFNM
ncbi:MAG: hypothetical protein EOO65_03660 [Methanosarcinales archaeon]|nr:MAG: hypothetical protein EOO65_03660 [Methanosarcinales archaeon]